ncbi:isoprenyl transferase [uncultured Porphyromonas sp.]|uniref:isoprenyl transferase n=1 Tax=uncultured Porphyromonas sp. TaxID=159274 RepID=UPI00259BEE42|nr:isoprenyl transferase [uncultured Porphyromonas sp.]
MMESALAKIDKDRIPRHIAIIMDGNGRWAKQQGNKRTYGHERGVETVRTILKVANELGVKTLTLYTFSEENWKRPQEEVETLMRLLVTAVDNELEELKSNNIRLEVLGNMAELPKEPQEALQRAIHETASNTGCQVVLAINYSGRSELIHAAKQLVKKGCTEIDEKLFSENLYLPTLSDPDLLIRTGGEYRISNFLLWQLAYTELYFTPTFWPDFGKEELFKAILDFQQRERRFGKTGEQVSDRKIER